jgi:chromosome partitioning protein
MIISTVSLKGGAGKTTISVNLAVELAHQHKKVILIDADPNNQNAIKWSGFRSEDYPLVTTVGLTDPAALRKNINSLETQSDYVVIDGTPALAELTGTIMLLSDLVILPLRSSTWDIWAFNDKFLPKLNDAKSLRPDLDCRILRNAVSKNKLISKEVYEVLSEYDLPILNTVIGDRTIFEVCPMHGKGVSECNDEKAKEEIKKLREECQEIFTKKLEMV